MWKLIDDEFFEADHQGIILLASNGWFLGKFDGFKRDSHDLTWWINDAYYDGDYEPTHWIEIPYPQK